MTIQEIMAIAIGVCALINTLVGLRTLFLTKKVEIATNSMKDELVAVTRSDALQEGITKGRATRG